MVSILHRLVWVAAIAEGLACLATGAYLGLRQRQPPSTLGACEVPASSQACQAITAGQSQTHDPIVCTTRDNRYYHRRSCRYVRSSKVPMRLSQAQQRHRPCSRCKPSR